jgi:hypothetical protein
MVAARSYRQSNREAMVAFENLWTLATRLAQNIALFGALSLVWAVVFWMVLR